MAREVKTFLRLAPAECRYLDRYLLRLHFAPAADGIHNHSEPVISGFFRSRPPSQAVLTSPLLLCTENLSPTHHPDIKHRLRITIPFRRVRFYQHAVCVVRR